MFSLTDREFYQLAAYIKSNYGIDLKEEKRAMVEGRLNNLLMQKKISNFSDYFHSVMADTTGDAVTKLVNKITTNHTFFMREADHFHFFKDKALPELKEHIKNKDLRI